MVGVGTFLGWDHEQLPYGGGQGGLEYCLHLQSIDRDERYWIRSEFAWP
jgi:hypothetical protein